MIKLRKACLTALLVLLSPLAVNATPITSESDPALNGSTLIDFESIAPGEYAVIPLVGVTINAIGANLTICTACGGAFGSIGQSLNTRSGGSFELVFDNLVSAFGIQGGAYNNGWQITAYDSLDNVIEVSNINNACCNAYYDGIAAPGISRVTLNGFGDWVVFDNLRFVAGGTTVPVPEPGSLALLGLGLAGIGFARRKKA